MEAKQLISVLKSHGFDFFTGVPCSYLAPLVKVINETSDSSRYHVPAVREDSAAAVAAGAYLSGKMPVLYMQNSGLGYSLEVFASLHIIYRIPSLVLLSYRGPEDVNMEEHVVMGLHTEEILNTFGLEYAVFRGDPAGLQVTEAKQYLLEQQKPYFLLITKGSLT